MLFLITHIHSPERCPGLQGAEAGRAFLKTLSDEEASKVGVTLVGSYLAPTEHKLIFVVEAESLWNIEGFTFDRLALVGKTEITPIVTIKEALEDD